MIITNDPVQVSYFIADISAAVAGYNRIRWHRSISGQAGLYTVVTGAAAAAPSLTSPNAEPHQLNGKTLNIRINGTTDVEVVFASSDPVSSLDAGTEITGETALLTADVDSDGCLVLTGVTTGSNSTIEITGGDAAPYLGFGTGDGSAGLDQDSVLVGGTHEYFYTDYNSSTDYWYRVELLHSSLLDSTGLGVPFPANAADKVAASQTLVAFIRLADLSGYAIPGKRITINNTFAPNLAVDQSRNWGIFRHSVQMTTDRNGYAEIRLLRGAVVDVSIDGTGFVRRITIPTTGDAVDLLDSSLVSSDEFGIVQPTIDFAIRFS